MATVTANIGVGPEGESFGLTADLETRIPGTEVEVVQALADQAHAFVLAGRAAVTAANAGDLATQTAALAALVAQIVTLSKS